MSVAYSDSVRRVVTYKFFVKRKPYPKLARRKAVATATALHKRMYTAFAEYAMCIRLATVEFSDSSLTETMLQLYLPSAPKVY